MIVAHGYITFIHEQMYVNNPQEIPRFIEEGLIFFTHIDDQWQFHIPTITTTTKTNCPN